MENKEKQTETKIQLKELETDEFDTLTLESLGTLSLPEQKLILTKKLLPLVSSMISPGFSVSILLDMIIEQHSNSKTLLSDKTALQSIILNCKNVLKNPWKPDSEIVKSLKKNLIINPQFEKTNKDFFFYYFHLVSEEESNQEQSNFYIQEIESRKLEFQGFMFKFRYYFFGQCFNQIISNLPNRSFYLRILCSRQQDTDFVGLIKEQMDKIQNDNQMELFFTFLKALNYHFHRQENQMDSFAIPLLFEYSKKERFHYLCFEILLKFASSNTAFEKYKKEIFDFEISSKVSSEFFCWFFPNIQTQLTKEELKIVKREHLKRFYECKLKKEWFECFNAIFTNEDITKKECDTFFIYFESLDDYDEEILLSAFCCFENIFKEVNEMNIEVRDTILPWIIKLIPFVIKYGKVMSNINYDSDDDYDSETIKSCFTEIIETSSVKWKNEFLTFLSPKIEELFKMNNIDYFELGLLINVLVGKPIPLNDCLMKKLMNFHTKKNNMTEEWLNTMQMYFSDISELFPDQMKEIYSSLLNCIQNENRKFFATIMFNLIAHWSCEIDYKELVSLFFSDEINSITEMLLDKNKIPMDHPNIRLLKKNLMTKISNVRDPFNLHIYLSHMIPLCFLESKLDSDYLDEMLPYCLTYYKENVRDKWNPGCYSALKLILSLFRHYGNIFENFSSKLVDHLFVQYQGSQDDIDFYGESESCFESSRICTQTIVELSIFKSKSLFVSLSKFNYSSARKKKSLRMLEIYLFVNLTFHYELYFTHDDFDEILNEVMLYEGETFRIEKTKILAILSKLNRTKISDSIDKFGREWFNYTLEFYTEYTEYEKELVVDVLSEFLLEQFSFFYPNENIQLLMYKNQIRMIFDGLYVRLYPKISNSQDINFRFE
eukprot:gene2549-3511_t